MRSYPPISFIANVCVSGVVKKEKFGVQVKFCGTWNAAVKLWTHSCHVDQKWPVDDKEAEDI